MSQTLEIPDSLYDVLKKAADASGATPLAWIADQLSRAQSLEAPEEEQKATPKTLADMFAGRVGRIKSGGKENLSEDCGKKFADCLEEKRSAGRL